MLFSIRYKKRLCYHLQGFFFFCRLSELSSVLHSALPLRMSTRRICYIPCTRFCDITTLFAEDECRPHQGTRRPGLPALHMRVCPRRQPSFRFVIYNGDTACRSFPTVSGLSLPSVVLFTVSGRRCEP